MDKEIDITKIALSRKEIKLLRKIRQLGVISDSQNELDSVISRLYDRGVIQRTCSNQFPFPELVDGFVTIPYNAFEISDAGMQYLNMIQDRNTERFKTRTIAI